MMDVAVDIDSCRFKNIDELILGTMFHEFDYIFVKYITEEFFQRRIPSSEVLTKLRYKLYIINLIVCRAIKHKNRAYMDMHNPKDSYHKFHITYGLDKSNGLACLAITSFTLILRIIIRKVVQSFELEKRTLPSFSNPEVFVAIDNF